MMQHSSSGLLIACVEELSKVYGHTEAPDDATQRKMDQGFKRLAEIRHNTTADPFTDSRYVQTTDLSSKADFTLDFIVGYFVPESKWVAMQ